MNCSASVQRLAVKRSLVQLAQVLLLLTSVQAGSALAAERVTVTYGLLERSLSVQALEEYAHTGRASKALHGYLKNLDEQQESQLRQFLIAKAELNVSTRSKAKFCFSGWAK
jgi:hypothetical protein